MVFLWLHSNRCADFSLVGPDLAIDALAGPNLAIDTLAGPDLVNDSQCGGFLNFLAFFDFVALVAL